VFLQYLLGFRRLGWDVVFLDRLEPDMCVDRAGRVVPVQESVNLTYLAQVMDRFGLGDSWFLLHDGGRETFGLGRDEVCRRLRRSAFLLNVMGFLDDEDLLAAAPRRVFLDIDPGFTQMWRVLGLHDLLGGHDDHVTIGANIHRPSCMVPTAGVEWLTTKQPVVLQQWPVAEGSGRGFTSIASWRGPFGPVDHEGRTYGLRVHEFRQFLELPTRTGAELEMALDIHEAEVDDLRRLRAHGWRLVDPCEVTCDPWRYQAFIQRSAAEFMVAKNMYVQSRSGWISDRSICYLASGRPVLAQDTGLDDVVPIGEGLLTFTTLDEAVAGVAEVTAEPARHRRAARELAEEHFAAERVLGLLLDRLGVGRSGCRVPR
jgi:hypothetical protein